ncbi:hypothetical protein [Micavibrio aeruginosavorus]|uniref:Uncharacterized protein n=1 Tax=Micavibrio aeruginosavorus EPB TaxID=349215 RepID=M4VKN1_9BACT|nr:hypothetical protein [Micavibrio aeruginosavorus]AGH99050.1 hypothetical protein A11S_2254 [Micavibrio aeruginosavorus EPB]
MDTQKIIQGTKAAGWDLKTVFTHVVQGTPGHMASTAKLFFAPLTCVFKEKSGAYLDQVWAEDAARFKARTALLGEKLRQNPYRAPRSE